MTRGYVLPTVELSDCKRLTTPARKAMTESDIWSHLSQCEYTVPQLSKLLLFVNATQKALKHEIARLNLTMCVQLPVIPNYLAMFQELA